MSISQKEIRKEIMEVINSLRKNVNTLKKISEEKEIYNSEFGLEIDALQWKIFKSTNALENLHANLGL